MSNLIKALFKYIFLLFLFSVIVFFIGYYFRDKTRPIENLVARHVVTRIFPDTTGMGMRIDTVLTPEQELALQIEERQQNLTRQEFAVDSLKQALQDSIQSISSMRIQLAAVRTDLTQQENENLDKLAKLYESIKPAAAAPILDQLNDQTIAEILYRMNDRQAGKIMGELDPVRAADITKRLRQLQQQVR